MKDIAQYTRVEFYTFLMLFRMQLVYVLQISPWPLAIVGCISNINTLWYCGRFPSNKTLCLQLTLWSIPYLKRSLTSTNASVLVFYGTCVTTEQWLGFSVTEFERLNLLPAKCCLNIRTYKFAPELLLLLTSMIVVIFSEYPTLYPLLFWFRSISTIVVFFSLFTDGYQLKQINRWM